MQKNHWVSGIKGNLKIKVSGKLIEPFLNQCVKEGIHFWEIKRHGEHTISLYCSLEDLKEIRKWAKKYNCKLRFIKKGGYPFFLQKMFKNSGIMTGIILFLCVIFILSNMVWDIKIEGATAQIRHEVRKEIVALGIKKGAFQFLLPDNDYIQRTIVSKLDKVSWIGAELKGTTYHFQVVERTKPDEQEQLSPRHLVAKKKAIIHDLFVEEGQTKVKVNDYVKKGDMLVSGIIGNEKSTKIVSAKGSVLGETWYKVQVKQPLISKYSVLTGNTRNKHYVKIFNLPILVWGFEKNTFKTFKEDESERSLRFLKWELPIKYMKKTYYEQETIKNIYNVKEADLKAREIGKKRLLGSFEGEVTIKDEKVLQSTNENGKVILTILYQIIEEISNPQPIIQGD